MAARRCRWRAMRRLMLSSPGSGPEDGGGAAVARYVTGACLTATCSAKRLFPERMPPTISVRWAMNEPSSLASAPAHRPEGRGDLRKSGSMEHSTEYEVQSTKYRVRSTESGGLRSSTPPSVRRIPHLVLRTRYSAPLYLLRRLDLQILMIGGEFGQAEDDVRETIRLNSVRRLQAHQDLAG